MNLGFFIILKLVIYFILKKKFENIKSRIIYLRVVFFLYYNKIVVIEENIFEYL